VDHIHGLKPLYAREKMHKVGTEAPSEEAEPMAHPTKHPPDLQAIPMLKYESLYVGIDVGKQRHVAGFVSSTLLARHERFEACPALAFPQSREGFRSLIERLRSYVPLEQVYVLLEQTGHYHRPLVQYLQEFDIPVYIMPVQKRPPGILKTDKRDALSLANHLFNQLERGIQLADKTHLVRRLLPPTEAALQLKGWMRHRYELVQECTQRKNKLTAICDELFPAMTQVLKDPNLPTALALREHFPTPQALAIAPFSALVARLGQEPPHPVPVGATSAIGQPEYWHQRGHAPTGPGPGAKPAHSRTPYVAGAY
jgi:hypothetical protein